MTVRDDVAIAMGRSVIERAARKGVPALFPLGADDILGVRDLEDGRVAVDTYDGHGFVLDAEAVRRLADHQAAKERAGREHGLHALIPERIAQGGRE